jgi:DNA-binding MarR family transcriptional regulator
VQITVGEDRRSRDVSITAEGRKLLKDARRLWRRAQRSFEAELGQQEAAALRTVLRRVAEADFALP